VPAQVRDTLNLGSGLLLLPHIPPLLVPLLPLPCLVAHRVPGSTAHHHGWGSSARLRRHVQQAHVGARSIWPSGMQDLSTR
jgi:hypothetical protein